jgi:hypothetical protein
MDVARVAELADRHGAQLSHWPRHEALSARALLAASSEARSVLARAERLDQVLSEGRKRSVGVNLRENILAAAPGGSWREFVASLWPFGPVWRPAMALFGSALVGIFLGSMDTASLALPISVNGALSEEIHVVAMSGIDAVGEDNQWPQ